MSPTSLPCVAMSVDETTDLLGISRRLAYEQIQGGLARRRTPTAVRVWVRRTPDEGDMT